MELVNYDEAFLPGMADLVQKTHPLHEISLKTMRRITLEDPNFMPNDLVIARAEKDLAGAALGARYRKEPTEKVEDTTAYLKVICTLPFDESLMKTLLDNVEDRMRSEGSTKLIYSNFASWHLLPGVDLRYENLLDFLLREGFVKVGQCVDYVIDLHAFRVPQRIQRNEQELIGQGLSMRLARIDERERIRAWVISHSGYNWAYEAARAVGSVGSGVWIAEEKDELIAFSVFGSLEHHWFGPIAVAEEKRKKGLGSVLLFKTLQSMKELGIPRAIIPWTGHLYFYSQVPGVVGLRHYWMMGKDL